MIFDGHVQGSQCNMYHHACIFSPTMASKQAENDGVFNIGLLKPAAFFAADIAFLAYVRQKVCARGTL